MKPLATGHPNSGTDAVAGFGAVFCVEKEIQRQIQQESQRLVQDVLKRSTSLARPPPSSDSARATLGACLQRALATTCLEEHPTPTTTADAGRTTGDTPGNFGQPL